MCACYPVYGYYLGTAKQGNGHTEFTLQIVTFCVLDSANSPVLNCSGFARNLPCGSLHSVFLQVALRYITLVLPILLVQNV